MIPPLTYDFFANDKTGPAHKSFQGKVKQSDQAVKGLNASISRVGSSLGSLGAIAGGLGIAAGVRDSLRLFDEQAQAIAKVETAVMSTGGAAGLAVSELKDLASGLQDITTFGDENILANVTTPLLTFTKIAGPQFERAQGLVLDLSTALGTDLKSASVQVGKALNDPIAGINALARAGVQFNDQQKDTIKGLVETGNIAEAQGIILDELATQFGGQAAAAAQAGLGPLQQLSNAWGDFKELIGQGAAQLLPPVVSGLKSLVGAFQALPTPVTNAIGVIAGVSAVALPLLGTFGLLTTAIGGLAPVVAAVSGVIGLILSPIGLIATAFAGAVTAAYLFRDEIAQVIGFDAFTVVKDFANRTIGTITGAYDFVIATWNNFPAALADVFVRGVNFAVKQIDALIKRSVDGVNDFVGLVNNLPFVDFDKVSTPQGLGVIDNPFKGEATRGIEAFQSSLNRDFISELFGGESEVFEPIKANIAAVTNQFDGLGVEADEVAASVSSIGLASEKASDALGTVGNRKRDLQNVSAAALGVRSELAQTTRDANTFNTAFASIGSNVSNGLRDIFRDGKVEAREFGDLLLNVFDKVADNLISGSFNQIGSGLNSLFSSGGSPSGGGILGSIIGGVTSLFGFASGGAFNNGSVVPFANGTVVSSPTFFPMAGGRTGVMAEAGAEAIMPLRRMSDGRLGVEASSSGRPGNDASPPTQSVVRLELNSSLLQAMVRQGAVEVVSEAGPQIAAQAVRATGQQLGPLSQRNRDTVG